MATLQIVEFEDSGKDEQGRDLQIAKTIVTTQNVTYSTSAKSAALSPNTHFVRLIATATVHVEFGADPTATANSMRIPANQVEYFGVAPGFKIAAYDGSS